jgi:pimeloyl-ACP methyl ester carboxylesterase
LKHFNLIVPTSYWDLAFNNFENSYVDTALAAGYATIAYDRLGIGNSSHGEPRDEIQSFLEVEGLAALTRKVRAGTFPAAPKFNRVIHVGHSFGSVQTYALTAKYPELSDGIVLTGFSMNSSFVGYFPAGADFQQAALNQPLRLGSSANVAAAKKFVNRYEIADFIAPVDFTTVTPLNYPFGYLTNSNVGALQYLFLLQPYYDPAIGAMAEATKQPVTIGEVLTLGSVPMTNPYTKSVLVLTGSRDVPYCGGDCLNTGGAGASIPAAVRKSFPAAKSFEAYIQPNTAHGINLHYNATGAYSYIQSWLKRQGL